MASRAPDRKIRIGDVEAAGWFDDASGEMRWTFSRSYWTFGETRSSKYILESQLDQIVQLISRIDGEAT
jgi:hypothetical protein